MLGAGEGCSSAVSESPLVSTSSRAAHAMGTGRTKFKDVEWLKTVVAAAMAGVGQAMEGGMVALTRWCKVQNEHEGHSVKAWKWLWHLD